MTITLTLHNNILIKIVIRLNARFFSSINTHTLQAVKNSLIAKPPQKELQELYRNSVASYSTKLKAPEYRFNIQNFINC
jgi:hypothetical protein